jgi:hypothetical protein
MIKRKKVFGCIAALSVLVIFFAPSSAVGAPAVSDYEVGASIGSWFGGNIVIEGYDLDKDGSFLFKGFADMFVTPKFAVGAYFNFTPFSIEDMVDVTSVEFGFALKPKISLNDQFAIKPGLNVGYRSLSSDDADAEADGLAVNLSVEFQYHLANGVIPYIDFGFLSQPVGGNSNFDITWGPILHLTVGIAYGF